MLSSWPRLSLLLLLVGIASVPPVSGQEEVSPFRISPDLRLLGATAELAYLGLDLIPGLETEFALSASGAYQNSSYFRNPDGGFVRPAQFADADQVAKLTSYPQLNIIWYGGARQELVSDFWVEAFYRGWLSKNFLDETEPANLMRNSLAPDSQFILANSFILALRIDTLVSAPFSGIKTGVQTILSVEAAPLGLNGEGQASYLRASLESKLFIPLIEETNPQDQKNIFSAYLGLYNITDYTTGLSPDLAFDGVPTHIRQSFGGLSSREGLGGAVRGFNAGLFDAAVKSATSLELRANLPTLIFPGLVPVFLIYADLGVWGLPIEGGPDADTWGSIASTGAGLGLDLFGFGTVLVYTHVALKETPLENKAWTPVAIGFGLHF